MAQDKQRHKEKPEDGQYQTKLVTVLRTTKVVAGGRNFRFVGVVVVGDGNGRVGYGHGKSREVPDAIRKATEMAKKNMIQVHMNNGTVFHELKAEHGATKVSIRPSPQGSGIIAGGPMRSIFEVMGMQNISAKCYGSTRAMNVIHATFKALKSMQSPFSVAQKRGLTLEQIGIASAQEETVSEETSHG